MVLRVVMWYGSQKRYIHCILSIRTYLYISLFKKKSFKESVSYYEKTNNCKWNLQWNRLHEWMRTWKALKVSFKKFLLKSLDLLWKGLHIYFFLACVNNIYCIYLFVNSKLIWNSCAYLEKNYNISNTWRTDKQYQR